MFPRVAGLLLVGIGLIVTGIIRYRTEVLYTVTLVVRLVFCAGFLALYFYAHDPVFLVILAVVSLGVVLTGASFLAERGRDGRDP